MQSEKLPRRYARLDTLGLFELQGKNDQAGSDTIEGIGVAQEVFAILVQSVVFKNIG